MKQRGSGLKPWGLSSHLLIDQRGQVGKLRAVGVFIGRQEALVIDAHGADIKFPHSDITAY